MRNRIQRGRNRQEGAILFIALMFLVTITLLTTSSMRTSNISLNLAHNEETRIVATQSAQALADAIVADPHATPVIGDSGHSVCTAGEYGCTRNDLTVQDASLLGEIAANHISARVERTGSLFRPPPRAVQTSMDKFSSASFKATTTFDRASEGLGRQSVVQGVLVLVPNP